MALVDVEGRCLQVNDALCRITGHSRDTFKATTLRALTHPEDVDLDAESLRELLDGRVPSYQTEKRYRHAWGHYLWGLSDRIARPRRRGQGPLRRLPGPGHLRAKRAGAAPRVPDRSRLLDRARQPAPLRAGAVARGRAGGALRRPRRRARDRPRQFQGGQRRIRPQGGRRSSQGRGGSRETSHPPDGPPRADRRRRVRGAASAGGCRPGPGRGGRHRQGPGPARGGARRPVDPRHGERGPRHVRRSLRDRGAGVRRPRDVRGQAGGPKPVCAVLPRDGTPGAGFGAASHEAERLRTALEDDRFVLYGQPILDLRENERSPVRGPAAPPRRRGRRAAHAQHVPVRRRATSG